MSVHMPTVPEKKDRRVALVVVDAQNKFLVGASEQAIRGKEAHVPVIAEAVRMFHEAGRPVVFVLYDGALASWAAGCLRERFRSSCGSGLELRPASA